MESLAGSVVLVLLLAALFACGSLWTAGWFSASRGRPLLAWVPRREPPWGLADLLVALLLLQFCHLVAAMVLRGRLGIDVGVSVENLPLSQQGWIMLAGSLAVLATAALSMAWIAMRHRAEPAEFGLAASALSGDLRAGLAAFLMIAPIVYAIQSILVQWFPSAHPLAELLRKSPDLRYLAICFLAAVVVAPLAEEYLFRGLLQGWLERVYVHHSSDVRAILLGGRTAPAPAAEPAVGWATHAANPPLGDVPSPPPDIRAANELSPKTNWPPIVISSLLFALAHWSHGPDPVPLFLLALGLGYLYQRTGRLWASVVLHMALNLVSLASLWLSVTLPDVGGS